MTQISSDAIRLSINETKIKATAMGIRIGIGNRIKIGGGGGQSWESYWASQPEVLFFGLYSEISGGQMPNKVTGSSDYLTVAGAVGSETYQCPNTAPYIAADTDYIWFKTDTSQRTVTTAELIGYDLQRTPVKYGDAAPNEIVAIIILNAAVTGTKRDNLFRDMWLPILWDNNLNGYGHIKDNRIGQQLWTPEAAATFIDSFTDVDATAIALHTPDSNNFTWTILLGAMSIVDNKLCPTMSSGILNVAYFDTGSVDVDMSVTLTIPDGDYNAGFFIRIKSSTEFFRALIRRASGGTPAVHVYKQAVSVISANVAHEVGDGLLRCVVSGNNFTVYWKGVKVIDEYVSDGSYNTYQKHGLFGFITSPYLV
jgi:hypothetical protein